ncbi:MAG: tyrosine--tRNA ligase, partial [Myxococcota bacterium]|nr:tyrosine--tRNA ligase [Myxococcota bacterium]
EQGISYTEFTYMLLQAYDFMHLYDHEGCTIQLGGSDQWGNILSGRELIRRRLGGRAEGITFPLLMTSSGKKFGKSEAGAIWLDAELTSPYQLYQYWLQSADADVIRYLKLFTFLSQEEIETLAQETKRAPEQREAQRCLAAANTKIIHGADAVRAVETVSRILFSGSKERPDRRVIDMLAAELPSATIERAALAEGVKVGALLSMTGLAKSNKAARQLLQGGGVSINNERLSVEQQQLTEIPGGWEGALLLQVGKKRHALIQVSE